MEEVELEGLLVLLRVLLEMRVYTYVTYVRLLGGEIALVKDGELWGLWQIRLWSFGLCVLHQLQSGVPVSEAQNLRWV